MRSIFTKTISGDKLFSPPSQGHAGALPWERRGWSSLTHRTTGAQVPPGTTSGRSSETFRSVAYTGSRVKGNCPRAPRREGHTAAGLARSQTWAPHKVPFPDKHPTWWELSCRRLPVSVQVKQTRFPGKHTHEEHVSCEVTRGDLLAQPLKTVGSPVPAPPGVSDKNKSASSAASPATCSDPSIGRSMPDR